MSNTVMVSVVIATYKRETELSRALNSLSEQNFSDFEIVVIDDNNNTEWNNKVRNIINGFQTRFPNIVLKYIKNEKNIGSARSRNEGINNSCGEYITFLDDDDIYLPEKLNNQCQAMKASNADYSITDLELCNEDFETTEIRTREYVKNISEDELLKYHLMYHLTGTDTLMFKRDYLLKIGSFPPIDVGDEFYLMERAIKGGGKFIYVPVCDVKAVVHSGEAGLSGGQGKIDGENRLFEHKKQYFSFLDKKTVRYIKMRHYAVLAFAYYRMNDYAKTVRYGITSFFKAPASCLRLFITRKSSTEG